MQLSPRQQQILTFLQPSPSASIAEIREHLGLRSDGTVVEHLAAMEKKGVLRRRPGQNRNIELLGPFQPRMVRSVPLLGEIPAGHPIDSEQQADRCIAIDEDMIQVPRNARTFALKVVGDSMIGAAIQDGDFVICEMVGGANHGDIVAALVDGQTTLKRFVIEKGRPFLKAENPRYKTLTPAHELVIQGVFRCLIRPARKTA